MFKSIAGERVKLPGPLEYLYSKHYKLLNRFKVITENDNLSTTNQSWKFQKYNNANNNNHKSDVNISLDQKRKSPTEIYGFVNSEIGKMKINPKLNKNVNNPNYKRKSIPYEKRNHSVIRNNNSLLIQLKKENTKNKELSLKYRNIFNLDGE